MIFVAVMTPGVMAIARRAAAFTSGTVCRIQWILGVLFPFAIFVVELPINTWLMKRGSTSGANYLSATCWIQAWIAFLCAQSPGGGAETYRGLVLLYTKCFPRGKDTNTIWKLEFSHILPLVGEQKICRWNHNQAKPLSLLMGCVLSNAIIQFVSYGG